MRHLHHQRPAVARVPDSIPSRGLNLFRVSRPARSINALTAGDPQTLEGLNQDHNHVATPAPAALPRVGQHRSAHERARLQVRLALATTPPLRPKAGNQSIPPTVPKAKVRIPAATHPGPQRSGEPVPGNWRALLRVIPAPPLASPLPPARQSTERRRRSPGVRGAFCSRAASRRSAHFSFLSFLFLFTF